MGIIGIITRLSFKIRTMHRARINSTPRLFPSGCSLSFVAIVLCAALCQGTHASDRHNRFRSALGIGDLTAMILQYSMYDREAERVLTADPTLAHLYNDHAGGFEQEPAGVQVTGAGDAQVNGWYA